MGTILASYRDLTAESVLLRLALALLFGGVIGLERGRKRRAAGFRTYMLVCLGAALTMLLGQYLAEMLNSHWSGAARYLPRTDVARFGAQVINGIGFLGAGTTIVTSRQEVKGLTTAAGLWASSCMGLAIGAGFYECIILGLVMMLLCVLVLPYVETWIVQSTHNMNLYVEFTALENMGDILGCIKAQDAVVFDVDIEHGRKDRAQGPSAVFSLRLSKRWAHSTLIAAIAKLECVRVINEI